MASKFEKFPLFRKIFMGLKTILYMYVEFARRSKSRLLFTPALINSLQHNALHCRWCSRHQTCQRKTEHHSHQPNYYFHEDKSLLYLLKHLEFIQTRVLLQLQKVLSAKQQQNNNNRIMMIINNRRASSILLLLLLSTSAVIEAMGCFPTLKLSCLGIAKSSNLCSCQFYEKAPFPHKPL